MHHSSYFKALTVVLFAGLSFSSAAQDCKKYYYLTNNAVITMSMYDRNGKDDGKQTWQVTGVKSDKSGTVANVATVLTNGKGKEISKAAGTYRCSGGKLMADIRMMMPADKRNEELVTDATLKPSYAEYPSKMSEGMSLPDAIFDIEVNTSGMPSTVHFELVNRKVGAKETVTSPAGNWQAFKITSNSEMKIKMAGIGIPVNMQITEWFVPDFGAVKTETYNKKGKLIGSSLLTEFVK